MLLLLSCRLQRRSLVTSGCASAAVDKFSMFRTKCIQLAGLHQLNEGLHVFFSLTAVGLDDGSPCLADLSCPSVASGNL